jgi:hypothetical protein
LQKQRNLTQGWAAALLQTAVTSKAWSQGLAQAKFFAEDPCAEFKKLHIWSCLRYSLPLKLVRLSNQLSQLTTATPLEGIGR